MNAPKINQGVVIALVLAVATDFIHQYSSAAAKKERFLYENSQRGTWEDFTWSFRVQFFMGTLCFGAMRERMMLMLSSKCFGMTFSSSANACGRTAFGF
ncbi:hypothetical protein SADUNF_Sadunf02G0199600 [Salix dunnii]|uniref:Uncharacterized protein n=1 Tax=Salix dunnii TaxID=1413687 RepID=A0A835N8Y3_9ROSI|nr:hypothetical protein SADUNF_Sadunf02G0199600 [Salix dunnii]